MTTPDTWSSEFRAVFNRAVAAWRAGRKSAATMFPPEDLKFLDSIGHTAQEMFDFVDDSQRYGEPDLDTALAVAAIRRRYFLEVQGGKRTGQLASMDTLPPKPAAVDGIPWLPRIIAKARIKLRGEMPDDLMYGCGGDRDFLDRVRISLPEFLQLAWDAGDDDRRIIEAVKRSANRA